MKPYAAESKVPVQQSRNEIEKMVTDRGASQFMAASDKEKGQSIIGWTIAGRMVRLEIPLPMRKNFSASSVGERKWEQAHRSRWRAVVLIVKAKFEAIASGVSTLEREFLADTVMADGSTVGRWMAPQLDGMYKTGKMPALLPGAGQASRDES